MKDPTRPPAFKDDSEPKPFQLQAIFDSEKKGRSPTALINGQAVKVGDRIRGYRVSQISGNTARLKKEGQVKALKIDSALPIIKRKVNED